MIKLLQGYKRKLVDMPAIEFLYDYLEIEHHKFSQVEKIILEMELFTKVCNEISNVYRIRYKEYFNLIKFNLEMERAMLDSNLIANVINDILLTGEYSLAGIALYTQIPEDVICDIATGKNQEPSLPLSRKIIELHRSVRPKLYQGIIQKAIQESQCKAMDDSKQDK
jgi:hypothetical protein